MKFSECLKSARKDAGLTQGQLAIKSGLNNYQISCYETGRHEPSLLTLCCLADALRVSTDHLLGRSDKR